MAWRCLRDALEYTLASLKPKLPHGGDDDDDDDGPAMIDRGRMHSGRGYDDDYCEFRNEGGSELLIGLKWTKIEIACMGREE